MSADSVTSTATTAVAAPPDFDAMIRALLKGREEKQAFDIHCKREIAALARAVEQALGAPEGALRPMDHNGVSGDDAVYLSEDSPGLMRFEFSLAIEYDLEMLANPRIAIARVPQPGGGCIVDVAGTRVETHCLVDPACVATVSDALRQAVHVEATRWLPTTVGGARETFVECPADAAADEATAGDSEGGAASLSSTGAKLWRAAMPALLQR